MDNDIVVRSVGTFAIVNVGTYNHANNHSSFQRLNERALFPDFYTYEFESEATVASASLHDF
jgi:hypothetical protein